MIDLIKAKNIAGQITETLAPHVVKMHLVGSLARDEITVKDIDIMVHPKKIFNQTDLFGGGHYTTDHNFFKAAQKLIAQITIGSLTGRYVQATLHCGITMDMFLPQPHDYYRHLAIRTGPASYAKQAIADTWVKKGWVGTELGLRRRHDCTHTPGGGWHCFAQNGEIPPEWQSEKEFFEWLGVPYMQPKYRTIKINETQSV